MSGGWGRWLARRGSETGDSGGSECSAYGLLTRHSVPHSAYTCKVADFGLSRRMDNDYYRASASGAIPLRWTAIEVLTASKDKRR